MDKEKDIEIGGRIQLKDIRNILKYNAEEIKQNEPFYENGDYEICFIDLEESTGIFTVHVLRKRRYKVKAATKDFIGYLERDLIIKELTAG